MNDPYWTSSSGETIQAFLKAHKPSKTFINDAHWIWVNNGNKIVDTEKEGSGAKVALEGMAVLHEVVSQLKAIETAPKKTGKDKGRSKTTQKLQAKAEGTKALKEIAVRNEYLTGKWCIYPGEGDVDLCFRKIATSLVEGALSETPAFLCKVATIDPTKSSEFTRQMICLYVPDAWNEDDCRQVLRALIRDCGIVPSAVKPDIYTVSVLDSKHKSKLRASVWTKAELLNAQETDDLINEYKTNHPDAKANLPKKREQVSSGGAKMKSAEEAMPASVEDKVDPGSNKRKRAQERQTDEGESPKKKTTAARFALAPPPQHEGFGDDDWD